MLLSLLEHYLAYWPFVVVHGVVLVAVLATYRRGRVGIARHQRDLERLAPVGVARDPWTGLWQRHADPRRPPFAEVRDDYGALIGGYVEDLARFANLLLLSGVAGTLWGLYSGVTRTGAAGASTDTVAATFDAFGVTIVAVVLAGVVIMLQRSMARFCEGALVQVSLAWERDRAADEHRPSEAAVIIERLEGVVAMFIPVVNEMRGQSERIQRDSKALDEVVAGCARLGESCAGLQVSFEQLPLSLRRAMDAVQQPFLDGLRATGETFHTQQATSLETVHAIATAADTERKLHVAGLQQLRGHNEDLFRELRGKTDEAFEKLKGDLFNLGQQIKGLDRGLEGSMTDFGARVSQLMAHQLLLIEGKLTTLLDVAPQVDRQLQQLAPSAELATRSVASVEASSVGAVTLVQRAVEELTGAIQRMDGQIRHAATAMSTLAVARVEAAPPVPPAVVGRSPLVLGAAAGAVMAVLLWILLRVA